MSKLRWPARVYIGGLTLLALGLIVFSLAATEMPSAERAMLAPLFAGLAVAVNLLPLPFGFKAKLTLDVSVTFAAILLFQPSIAILIVAGGSVLADMVRRQPWDELLFNGSQLAVQTGAGAWILVGSGWTAEPLLFSEPSQVLMIVVALATMHLVNSLAVATVVGLQSGLAPLYVWYRSTIRMERVEALWQLVQLGIGLLVAVLADAHLWALPLLVFPGFAIYRTLEQRRGELREETMNTVVESLADIVDVRDPYTANHSKQVAALAREISLGMDLPVDQVGIIERAARVHDVGKIIVDIGVLTKQDRLADYEWEQLRKHPSTGAEILNRFPEFALATSFVRHHHERIDGGGYPDGLRGDQIPMGARVIAVADSFDAMTRSRPYRPALPLHAALEVLAQGRGKQWDERVVNTLLELVAAGTIGVDSTDTVIPFLPTVAARRTG